MEETRVVPAFTVLTDEAGTPSFVNTDESVSPTGYVVASVVVPESEREYLTAVLPRSPRGAYLKSSSSKMSPDMAAEFIDKVLGTAVDIYLVLLSTGSAGNVEFAGKLTELARRRRLARHRPHISTSSLVYLLAAKDAIIGAWKRACSRLRAPLSYFDVVLDSASVSKRDQRVFRFGLGRHFDAHRVACRRITWSSDRHEPLLNIADIFAGAYLRQVTRRDARDAWERIEAAARAHRLSIQDGMTTIDPDKAMLSEGSG